MCIMHLNALNGQCWSELYHAPYIPSLIFNFPAIVSMLTWALSTIATAHRGGKDLDKQTGNSKKVL